MPDLREKTPNQGLENSRMPYEMIHKGQWYFPKFTNPRCCDTRLASIKNGRHIRTNRVIILTYQDIADIIPVKISGSDGKHVQQAASFPADRRRSLLTNLNGLSRHRC